MALTTLRTVDDVIEALGGAHAVARLTGRGFTSTCNWRKWQQFPAPLYFKMATRLNARGFVASPRLWGQEVTRLDLMAA